jgi:hypothetical protein
MYGKARTLLATLLTGALAAAGVGALMGQASAAPPEREHFSDIFTEVDEDFCGAGFDVQLDGDVWGSYVITRNGRDRLPRYRANIHGSIVHTNLSNDEFVTQVFNFSDRDQKITDNGDGTFTILIAATGGSKWNDSDGKLLFQDGGGFWFEILVDDDFEFLEFLREVKDTGRDDITGDNFCDQLVPALS